VNGAVRWGLKSVRLTADHAWYLKWLFPLAKFLFLFRNPYDAYRSFAARRDAGWKWFQRWPDQPLTVARFGRHWREAVESFLREESRVGALLVRYEELSAGRVEAIEDYLGFSLSREAASVNPSDGGPPALEAIRPEEFAELDREVGELAGALGYHRSERADGSVPAAARPQVEAVPSRSIVMENVHEQNGKQRVILGIGTGRCGTHTLAQILSRQPDARVTHEERPLLPWSAEDGGALIRERMARWGRTRIEGLVGDVASFYLPYVEEALGAEPEVRVVCLKRPREEVVQSFCRWLDTVHPLPTNHWAQEPGAGWHHDPVWTRIFPQYDMQDREEGIRRYWEEYYARVEELAGRYPGRIRVFDMQTAFNTDAGQRELLTFAGVAPEKQVLGPAHTNQSEQVKHHPRRGVAGIEDPRDPRRCVVLVPYSSHIVPDCENALRELEQRGYAVRRVRGYSAIDQGRSQMATDAMVQGFEETMWIDADVGFEPEAVERLRSCGEAVVCGIYPQKGKRALACHVLPGTQKLVFGQGGGLQEILYAGTGFLLVRRQVYMDMQRKLELPVCNERFGRPMIGYFQPLVRRSEDGWWYLAEDYSFCERARQCGYRVCADTTIRLWHVGQYSYSWEDAGLDRQRFGTFTYHLT
jgi:hypothetical protein